MTDLVERVARVIDPEAFDPLPGHEQGRCIDCDGSRDEARRMARAAIEAMREPDEAMKRAADLASPMYDDPATSGEEYWDAMITAALGEGGE